MTVPFVDGVHAEHLEHQVVLDGRDDVAARLFVQPALRGRSLVVVAGIVAEVKRLELAVLEAPGFHLLHRPLRRVLVVGRAGEPGTMHVGQVVHGLHDLGVVHALLADAGIHVLIDASRWLLRGRRGHDDAEHQQRGDKSAEHGISSGSSNFEVRSSNVRQLKPEA